MSKTLKLSIGVLAVILCAAGFYFLYWTKTPTYSLGIIRESIEKHDTTTFSRHVDLDTLCDKGFDEAIIATSKLQGLDDTLKDPLASKIIQGLKPLAMLSMKNAILASVKGDAALPEPSSDDGSKFATDLKTQTGINNSTITSISTISQDGDEAIVAIVENNKKLDRDSTITVKMTKLDDGTWCVKEITNLADFILDVERAAKKKLAELNEPIRAELASAITVSNPQLSHEDDGNPYFASHWLRYNFTFANNTDKDITKFVAKVSVTDDSNTYRETELTYDKVLPAHDSAKLFYNDDLNPFIPADAKLIKSPNNKHIAVEITSITYADGTVVTQLTKLPD